MSKFNSIGGDDKGFWCDPDATRAHLEKTVPGAVPTVEKSATGTVDGLQDVISSFTQIPQYILGVTNSPDKMDSWAKIGSKFKVTPDGRDNPFGRTLQVAGSMALGFFNTVTAHLPHNIANQLGYAKQTPFLTPFPTDLHAVVREYTAFGTIFIPGAIKTLAPELTMSAAAEATASVAKRAAAGAGKVYNVYADVVNAALKAGKPERPVSTMDAFDIAAQNPEFGAMRKVRVAKGLTMILDEKFIDAALHIDGLLLELAEDKLANSMHNDWRVSRSVVEGTAADGLPMREPRWKAVVTDDASLSKIPDPFKRTMDGKTEVDIANLDFNRLPAKYQSENAAAAKGAVRTIEKLVLTRNGYVIDVEEASAMVHDQWLERNGSWAPAEQNRPYAELSELEKEKDRVVVRAAAREINRPMPPDYVTIKLVEARK